MAEKRTVIVTGASGGIGRAIALAFGEKGDNVVVNYRSNEKSAKEIAEAIEKEGGSALIVKADVSDFDDAAHLVKTTIDHFGSVDVLINNSGITRDTLMLRMKEKDFDDVINVNLKGSWNMVKHVTRPMFKQKSGRIINISSVVGQIGNPGQANYVASKAALNGMTKSLAKEYGKKNVTVNAIAPGFIETEMTDSLSEEIKDHYMAQIPLGRFGRVEDIAKTAVFLASEDANYITGQILNVNGGMI